MQTHRTHTLTPELIRALNERNELVRECESLLWIISRRPGYLKLLLLVRNALQLYAGYKQPRFYRSGRSV